MRKKSKRRPSSIEFIKKKRLRRLKKRRNVRLQKLSMPNSRTNRPSRPTKFLENKVWNTCRIWSRLMRKIRSNRNRNKTLRK